METNKHWSRTFVYAAAHMVVDFACVFLMFRSAASTPDWHLCVLLYNFCAFALQMPLGVLADRWNHNAAFAALGCALVAVAYALFRFPVAAAVAVGVGNGMFHVGGGLDMLNISRQKSSALGVFVSPGAFGVYFGTLLGRGGILPTAPVLLTVLVAMTLILVLWRIKSEAYPPNAPFSVTVPSKRLLTPALVLFVVVCLRSYMGLALTFPWKGVGSWGLVLVCAVVAGKTAGGFLADRFGAQATACASLTLCTALLLLSHIPAAGVLAMLLFNMTMPITLWAMARIFPGAKGFGFGLLTFALFLGYLPVHFGIGTGLVGVWPAILAIASLALLWLGLRGQKHE